MASINTATNRVLTGGFITQVVLIAVGLAMSSMATDWMRDNVVDLQMAGADAVYGLVGALVVAFASTLGLPWKYGRPLAMGIAGGAVLSEMQAMDLV